jgi:hypothetical protein
VGREPPYSRQPFLNTHTHELRGLGGSGGVVVPLCSEAAHLFPGMRLPTPTHPSGNSLALGLWEKELHGSLPPMQVVVAEALATLTPFSLPTLEALTGQFLTTALGTQRTAGPRWHKVQCPVSE